MIPKYYDAINMKYIELLVVGPGGSGQTYFMKYIKRHTFTNHADDFDGLKHNSHPKNIDDTYIIKKCIFLYNDPLKSIHSHYRRKYFWENIKKIGNPYNLKKENINSLDEFMKQVEEKNEDLFGIEKQFLNWINGEKNYETYFLDFNDILEKKEELCNFLQVKENTFDTFEIKGRSRMRDLTMYENCLKLYKNLYVKMKEISSNENKKVKINSIYEIKRGIVNRRKKLNMFNSMISDNDKKKYN